MIYLFRRLLADLNGTGLSFENLVVRDVPSTLTSGRGHGKVRRVAVEGCAWSNRSALFVRTAANACRSGSAHVGVAVIGGRG